MANNEHLLPNEALEFIQRCVNIRKVRWTYYVNMRMKNRFISRQFILDSTNEHEIIEKYHKDKYLPSYLVYSRNMSLVFYVLFAVDVRGDNVRVVTAYYPNELEWKEDLKTRR